MADLDATTALTLQALEEAMWRPETRFDSKYMDAILADDFTEVGQSGRAYSRAETVELPPLEIDITFPLQSFVATSLAEGAALVRYTSVPARSTRGAANRASIWVHQSGWKLLYHQATPTDW